MHILIAPTPPSNTSVTDKPVADFAAQTATAIAAVAPNPAPPGHLPMGVYTAQTGEGVWQLAQRAIRDLKNNPAASDWIRQLDPNDQEDITKLAETICLRNDIIATDPLAAGTELVVDIDALRADKNFVPAPGQEVIRFKIKLSESNRTVQMPTPAPGYVGMAEVPESMIGRQNEILSHPLAVGLLPAAGIAATLAPDEAQITRVYVRGENGRPGHWEEMQTTGDLNWVDAGVATAAVLLGMGAGRGISVLAKRLTAQAAARTASQGGGSLAGGLIAGTDDFILTQGMRVIMPEEAVPHLIRRSGLNAEATAAAEAGLTRLIEFCPSLAPFATECQNMTLIQLVNRYVNGILRNTGWPQNAQSAMQYVLEMRGINPQLLETVRNTMRP